MTNRRLDRSAKAALSFSGLSPAHARSKPSERQKGIAARAPKLNYDLAAADLTLDSRSISWPVDGSSFLPPRPAPYITCSRERRVAGECGRRHFVSAPLGFGAPAGFGRWGHACFVINFLRSSARALAACVAPPPAAGMRNISCCGGSVLLLKSRFGMHKLTQKKKISLRFIIYIKQQSP